MDEVKALVMLMALVVFGSVAAAEPDARTRDEIAYLFSTLRSSDCQFFRNGDWYAAQRATQHLNTKYEYLLRKGLVSTTETFIDRAATRSSFSGKPYLVKCANADAVESHRWFSDELARYRATVRP